MVFRPVKKSSENILISLKAKCKHHVTYLKILNAEYKVTYLKITEAVTGDVPRKKVFFKILQISQENIFWPAT